MNSTEYKKLKVAFRYWLLGMAEHNAGYYRAVQALDLAEKYHEGLRKNGRHEFSHQITICQYLRTLHRYFILPEQVFIVALLHDTYEDYPESETEIRALFEDEFSMIRRISKVRDGKPIPYKQYFGEMSECMVCSLVKGVDRLANISTMLTVFSPGKQQEYLEEIDRWFFPMIKDARRLFPQQEPAYENIKSALSMMQQTILSFQRGEAQQAVVT